MRYRALDQNGDHTFGRGRQDFLTDSREAVAQAVLTRLRLMEKEWFLDIKEGTRYQTHVLGTGTKPLYDEEIKMRVLDTQGVTGIADYNSTANGDTRTLKINLLINTIYGDTVVSGEF